MSLTLSRYFIPKVPSCYLKVCVREIKREEKKDRDKQRDKGWKKIQIEIFSRWRQRDREERERKKTKKEN